jgi:hypothetical protein
MLISACLSSKAAYPTVTIGPVRILFGVSAEYSRRDLFAITSNVGVKLRAVESLKAEVVGRESGDLSFDLAFLKIFYISEMKFSGRFLFIHYPEIRLTKVKRTRVSLF